MKPLALIPLTVAVVASLSSCGSQPQSVAASTPSKAESPAAAADPLEIELRPDVRLEIKVGDPKMQPVSATLSVAGRVEADQTRMIRVTSPAAGRITELNVVEGQHVEKGQVIATIYSTELATAQSAFLKAHTERQQLERAVARARQLLDAGVIGSAELQRREAEAQQNATELSSLRKQLNVLGMPEDAVQKLETTRTIDSLTHIVAIASGQVLDRLVTQGQVIGAAEPLCVIADLSSLWLVADVPEEHARALRVGKRVEAEIPALPGEKKSGVLTYIGATVKPETRTILARMDLPNKDFRYKPAMLATMLLMDTAENRMVVPDTAVVRDGNDEAVYLEIAPNRYRMQRVLLGQEVPGGRVVLDGIPQGSKIVLEGAFYLNNERRRQNGGSDATE